MLSNGFLLHIERLSRILNSKLPQYSRISCVFKEFNNFGVNQVDLYAKYGFSNYEISIWIGDSEYFEYDDRDKVPFHFDVRVESESERGICCEYEFEHTQNFEETIDKAIQWIENELKD
jgi:hypothetical protein